MELQNCLDPMTKVLARLVEKGRRTNVMFSVEPDRCGQRITCQIYVEGRERGGTTVLCATDEDWPERIQIFLLQIEKGLSNLGID